MPEEPAVPANSVSKEPTKRYKSVRRDPSEPTPVNWQRKPHVADNIPSPIEPQIKLNSALTNADFGGGDVCAVGDYIYLDFDRDTAAPISTDLRPPKQFDVVRIQRFLNQKNELKMEVNYTVRPFSVLKRSVDSRELYATFKSRVVPLTQFRGKCSVQARNSIRNLPKYREKTSQFYIAKFYDIITHKVYDIVPVQSLKSLTHVKVAELRSVAEYAILNPEITNKLCENSKKRGPVVTSDAANTVSNASNANTESTEESANSEERLPQIWPFRYFDEIESRYLEECELPSNSPENRIGEDHQAPIEEWTGHRLRYYTQSISRSRQLELKYADSDSETENEKVDIELPYVQEMPSGYIARGTDSTSIPSSLPSEGIEEFVSKCRESCAKKLDVEPCNVEFLDACCSAYSNNVGYESAALIEVMNLKKSYIGIPELKDEETQILRKMLNPFLRISWHDIYKAIGTRTSAKIARYFWTRQLKRKRNIAFSQQIISVEECPEIVERRGCISEYESNQLLCAVCLTNTAYGWEALPHYMSLLPLEPKTHTHKYAMCSRCARLWYRYGVGWRPATEVKELESHEVIVDQDLLEDAKAYIVQEEKRVKRLANAMNKKQTSKSAKQPAKQTKNEESESKSGDKKTAEKKTTEKKPAEKKPAEKKTSEKKTAEKKTSEVDKKGDKKPKTKTETSGQKPEEAKKAAKEKSVSKKKPASNSNSASASAKSKTKSGDKTVDPALNPSSSKDEDGNDSDENVHADGTKTETGSKRAANDKETPAKRTKTVHPLSDDGIDALLETMDDVPDIETPVQSYTCTVCGQLDPSMVSKTCAGCGLSVHVACYGQGIAMKYKDNNLGRYTFSRDLKNTDSTDLTKEDKDENKSEEKEEEHDEEKEEKEENDFSGDKWLCDCCTNSRLLLNADPFYQCRFCPLFPMTYNEWMVGNTTQYPVDALKRAVDGTWCHVRCALYIPGVTFSNAREYEDIDDTDLDDELRNGVCAICYEEYGGKNEYASNKEKEKEKETEKEKDINGNLANPSADAPSTSALALGPSSVQDTSALNSETNGDSSVIAPADSASKETERQEIVKFSSSCYFSFPRSEGRQRCWNLGVKIQCSMCADKFHVSCASKKHFKMGFTKETIPKPIIVCSKHATCNIPLTPISYMDLNLNLTAMQLYVRTHKVSKQRAVYSAQELNSLLTERKAESTLLDEPLVVPFPSQFDSNRTAVCSYCLRKDRACYICLQKGVIVCTLCYTNHTWQPNEQNKLRKDELGGLTLSVLNKMYQKVCSESKHNFIN